MLTPSACLQPQKCTPKIHVQNCRHSSLSGTKNEPKPKLLSPDIFRWGGGLPHEGVGAKKFGMPLECREIKLFCRDIPGFCRDIPKLPEKFEKKKFGFNFRSLLYHPFQNHYTHEILFLNYLGGYSYSFQGSSELISITVTASLFSSRNSLPEIIPLRNSQEFSAIAVT